MLTGSYLEFHNQILSFIPKTRIFTDPLHTLAYGTDASFYRLVPKVVVRVETADEVGRILKICSSLGLPSVFRAAGTSLCGQSITDSILIVTSRDWNKMSINEDASLITMEPAVIASNANNFLKPYKKNYWT